MKNIDKYNFKDKKVLIRVDFNIPMNDKLEIVDDIRIKATIPTINKILSDGGIAILISHLGRPKNGYEPKYSLKHLVKHLNNFFVSPIIFSSDCIGEETLKKADSLKARDVMLLENVRFYEEELKDDIEFARSLSKIADVYVNDAFGACHRKHASISAINHFFRDKMMGYVMSQEISCADRIAKNFIYPYTTILGGAKVSDKIDLIDKLLENIDNLLIGGGMANTFLASLSYNMGMSKVQKNKLDVCKNILQRAQELKINLLLPKDLYFGSSFNETASKKLISIDDLENIENASNSWIALDIGPKTQREFEQIITKSNTILWNGPMGVFELQNFQEGTRHIGEAIANITNINTINKSLNTTNPGYYNHMSKHNLKIQNSSNNNNTNYSPFSLVGGGNTVSAIHTFKLENKISHVSTGGGALLAYIANGTLPGLEALYFSFYD